MPRQAISTKNFTLWHRAAAVVALAFLAAVDAQKGQLSGGLDALAARKRPLGIPPPARVGHRLVPCPTLARLFLEGHRHLACVSLALPATPRPGAQTRNHDPHQSDDDEGKTGDAPAAEQAAHAIQLTGPGPWPDCSPVAVAPSIERSSKCRPGQTHCQRRATLRRTSNGVRRIAPQRLRSPPGRCSLDSG